MIVTSNCRIASDCNCFFLININNIPRIAALPILYIFLIPSQIGLKFIEHHVVNVHFFISVDRYRGYNKHHNTVA